MKWVYVWLKIEKLLKIQGKDRWEMVEQESLTKSLAQLFSQGVPWKYKQGFI